MKQSKKHIALSFPKSTTWIFILIFSFAAAFSIYTAYFYSLQLLDSDASSELVLANLLSQQGSILTTDWFYSNEIRLLQTNLIFAPLFTLFSNWHTVRFIGTILLQAILLFSYYYACKQMKVSPRAYLCTAAILVLPFSIPYGRIVLFHTYYLPYCVIGFLLVGLFLSAVRHQKRPFSARQWCRILYGVFLSFGSGLTGVRQLMSTLVPLVFATIFLFFSQDRDERSATEAPKSFSVLLAFAMLLAGAAGFWVNTTILSQIYSLRVFDQINLSFAEVEDLRSILLGYLKQFGFQTGRMLLSVEGMLSCGGLFAAGYFAIKGGEAFKKKTSELPITNHYAWVFFPIATLLMIGVFVFTQGNLHYTLYLLPAIIWSLPLLAALLDKEIFSTSFSLTSITLRQGALLLCLFLLLANGCYNNLFFLNPEEKPVAYEGLGRTETDNIYRLEEVIEFLESDGYTHGYATFWNANIITEITHGKITMSDIIFENGIIAYHDWLSVKHFREREYIEKQVPFLLLAHNEVDAFSETPLAEFAYEVHYDYHYIVYGFDDPLDIWECMKR